MANREIKFRAWNKNIDHMYYLAGFAIYGDGEFKDRFIALYFENDGGLAQYDRNIIEILQYTGLQDKKGVDIYEGDWVKCHDNYYDDIPDFAGYVDFDGGSFMIRTDISTHYRLYDYGIEVIGNIYENPELLEESYKEKIDMRIDDYFKDLNKEEKNDQY